MTLITEAFRTYLVHERRRAPSTVERYLAAVTAFLAHRSIAPEERTAFESVSTSHVSQFLQEEDEERPSPARWNVQLSALRVFFAWLEREELVPRNPAKHVHFAKVTPPDIVPLTFEQMLALTEAIERHAPKKLKARDVAIVLVFCQTACQRA